MNQPVNNPNPLKVAIVCHSDILGGASIVTYRLASALRRAGVDARMIVLTKLSDSDNVSLVSTRFMRGVKFLGERSRIYAANGFNRENLFKVSIANTGHDIHKHEWVKKADIVMLSWVNQGLLSLSGIEKICQLGKPVVWVMHDMWNLTGICHHAYECKAYKAECGNCQFLTGEGKNDLSHKRWLKKRDLYANNPITFVAVSNWLAQKSRESSLMRDLDIKVIPNAFPVDHFITEATHALTSLNINYGRDIILMGAARLDDPIKGLGFAKDALNHIFDNYPEVAAKSQVIFFGDIRHKDALDGLRFNYTHLGRINDWRLLRQLYAAAKVVLSTSLYESFGATLVEGQAAGCLPVSFGRGGQTDIIEHKKNGFIAEYKNPESVAEGIIWALEQNPDRDELHESVRRRFSSDAVAQSYIRLFDELRGAAK